MTVELGVHADIIFAKGCGTRARPPQSTAVQLEEPRTRRSYWQKNDVPFSQYLQATPWVRAFTEPQPICCQSLEASASHTPRQWVSHWRTTITVVPTRIWLQVKSPRRQLTPRRGPIWRARPQICDQSYVSPWRQHQGSTRGSTIRTWISEHAGNSIQVRKSNRQRLRRKLKRLEREMLLLFIFLTNLTRPVYGRQWRNPRKSVRKRGVVGWM